MTRTMATQTDADRRRDEPGRGWTNPYGHFAADGSEFIITNPRTPRPWSNIIANPRMGLAVSQTGSGFTWIDNSQLAVITRWHQDLIEDASGKFLYVRDVDSGEAWSLSPAPMWPAYGAFACHHGLGYTTFRSEFDGIRAEWTLFCHASETVELWRLRLENMTERARRLEVSAYFEWCCGVAPSPRREFHKLFIETEFDAERGTIIARNHMWDVPSEKHGHWNTSFPYVSAFAGTEPVQAAQGDKGEFTGMYGNLRSPAALTQSTWSPRFGRHHDPVAALRSVVVLKPRATKSMGYALAIAESEQKAGGLLETHLSSQAIDHALEECRNGWRERLSEMRVDLPDATLTFLTNDWLRYQAISGRMWGRCGYYQQSGAYGFRDQLQDSQVWLGLEPDRCESQIKLHAAHQFSDGSVYHWWHPLTEQGLITRMTDDLLWLAYVTASYIKETGHLAIVDEPAPYLDDSSPAPLLEHIRRAFARVFARTSPRGLPYIGAGDWNDGISAAGLEEKGESVWLGQFLAGLLTDWAVISDRLGFGEEADEYRARRSRLVEAIEQHAWDGQWYIRATLDDGCKLGSAENETGRIFLNAQTWAILNEVAPPERASQCWQAVKEHLISKVGPLLLTPAFTRPDARIGYITRYAPGLRENGGVYTHAACWALAAACKMQDTTTVEHLLDVLNPAMRHPDRYWAEPYVTPGNIDGPESPYFGRGGWTWYTGSAAWLHRGVTEWVLGVRPDWDGLRVEPCLPPSWDRASIRRRYRGVVYRILIERDPDAADGVRPVLTVDGKALPGGIIPPPGEVGITREVLVECRIRGGQR